MKLRCLSTPHKVRGQYDDKSMADQVGVSKSEVSRETIEAGTRVLKELVERDLSELDVLVVYLDGIVFGAYHVLAAVGVDADGRKHVLGLCGGASENTEVTAGLLEDLVARGLRADRRRLFVIDGAKALRQAIGRVFGSSNLVQRCRNHKVRNVLGHLPKEQHEQARSTLRAAWKLDADEGIRKLEQYASWLEREWPSAAGSLREGLSEGVHGQSPWAAEAAAPLPDDDEHHRLVARWRSPAHESGESLAERGDGGAVGGGDVPRDGEALSPHHGLRASLDAEGAPRRRGRRPCRIAEGGVMCVCRCRLSTTGGTPSRAGSTHTGDRQWHIGTRRHRQRRSRCHQCGALGSRRKWCCSEAMTHHSRGDEHVAKGDAARQQPCQHQRRRSRTPEAIRTPDARPGRAERIATCLPALPPPYGTNRRTEKIPAIDAPGSRVRSERRRPARTPISTRAAGQVRRCGCPDPNGIHPLRGRGRWSGTPQSVRVSCHANERPDTEWECLGTSPVPEWAGRGLSRPVGWD